MAMVVQHNLTAMNANRMLGVTTSAQAKSTEKLSSGYRINRAADDAAGLTISEKMRKQIRGLDRAATNAQDGISAVQTAEGALTEVHSMLQRMNELAVQAANGTMSKDDRQAVQDEIDQLVTEIDRVAETTKFNEIYLLKGGEGTTTATKVTKEASVSVSYLDTITGNKTLEFDATAPTTLYATKDGVSTAVDGTNFDQFFEVGTISTPVTQDAADTATVTVNDATATETGTVQITGTDQSKLNATLLDGVTFTYDGTTDNRWEDADGNAVAADKLAEHFDENGVYKNTLYKLDTAGALTEVAAEQIDDYVQWTREAEKTEDVTVQNALEFNLHVGSESDPDNKIGVKIEAMSSQGIGVDVLKSNGVMSETSATKAIDTIADAIAKVSKQRSSLGAIQNRLEHTIANLDNVVENTTSAESRIRDTDMAEEMVEYSKNNILAQAGQSMLAQANQSTQGVLSLLQ